MIPAHKCPVRAVRAAASFALLMAAACLLFGCGSSSDHPPGRTHDAKTVLNFWNGFTGPDGATMQKMVRQFERDNPDVQVKMQLIPWATYYDKLTLSLAYGGAPDVFVVHAMRVPEFASFETLRPLDALYSSIKPGLLKSQFVPVAWQASFYQGRQVALPLDVHAMGLYYNTRLFKDAGIVDSHGNALPPVTWPDFLADAKKLTRDTTGNGRIDQWGFVFTNQHSNWFTFADQFGGGLLSPDGKTCILRSPQNIRALTVMHDLIYKYKVAPRPEGVDAWLAFQQGKAAMAMEGIYMLESLQEQKGLEFSGAPAPHFGPIQSVWTGSHMLCQPAGLPADRAAASWRLMRYLSDHSITWAEGGQIPARLDILKTPRFKSLTVQSQFARQLGYVRYEPLTPKTNSLFPFLDPAIEAVLLDLETPQKATAEAARRINQVLKRP